MNEDKYIKCHSCGECNVKEFGDGNKMNWRISCSHCQCILSYSAIHNKVDTRIEEALNELDFTSSRLKAYYENESMSIDALKSCIHDAWLRVNNIQVILKGDTQ